LEVLKPGDTIYPYLSVDWWILAPVPGPLAVAVGSRATLGRLAPARQSAATASSLLLEKEPKSGPVQTLAELASHQRHL